MTTVWLALFGLSSLAFLGAFGWMLVLAYRESTTWGLISTFIPFGAIAFAVKFWDESKYAVLLCISCFLVASVTGLGYSISTVNSGLGGNSGGADLWSDSSGFEAIPSTSERVSEEEGASTEVSPTPENTLNPDDEPAASLSAKQDSPTLRELDKLSPSAGPQPPGPLKTGRNKITPLEDLPKLQGERAALILQDGQRVFGVIENVGATKVILRKLVGGGSILFTIERRDIKEIQTRRWK